MAKEACSLMGAGDQREEEEPGSQDPFKVMTPITWFPEGSTSFPWHSTMSLENMKDSNIGSICVFNGL